MNMNWLHAFKNEVTYNTYNAIARWDLPKGHIYYCSENNKDTIVILFHGMNNYPRQFHEFFGSLTKKDISYFAPALLGRGNVPLDEAGFSVLTHLNIIKDYKKVVFIGISNGCRIALWVYSNLDPSLKDKEFSFYSIAGPLTGTKTATLALKTGFHYLTGHRRDVLEELEEKSEFSKCLINSFVASVNRPIKLTNYAAEQDLTVYPYNNSLPEFNSEHIKTENIVYSGVGHNSVVSLAHKSIMDQLK